MNKFTLAFPGKLTTKTGGYYYLTRILAELPKVGWSGTPLSLGIDFPNPSSKVLANAEKQLSTQPPEIQIIVDCLAWGVMNHCAQNLSTSHKIIPLIHHPLCLETGLSQSESSLLFEKEQEVLSISQRIITTSHDTSQCLQGMFHISKSKIFVATPGTDQAKQANGRQDDKIGLIAVGSVTPRKGYDRLIKVLKILEQLPWQLEIIGDDTLDPKYTESIIQQINELELTQRISLWGALPRSELNKFYDQSDIFVLATLYEGYGMAFTEAMVRGLPIIATGEGAVANTIPKEAGIVVESNDLTQFSSALSILITNSNQRELYGKGAFEAGKKLPSWFNTAEKIAAVLNTV